MRKFILLLVFVGLNLQSFAQADCSTAVEAVLGTNHLPVSGNDEYWYTYTMQSNSKLQISSSNINGSISTYNNSCDNLNLLSSASSTSNVLFVSSLNAGDEVFIEFRNTETDFDWEISEVPFEDGDLCTQPTAAVLGENFVPQVVTDEYWFSYSMQSTAKLKLSTTSGVVFAYHGSCDNLSTVAYNAYGAVTEVELIDLVIGDMVYFQWRSVRGDFNWLLEEVPLEEGESCNTSFQGLEGVNLAPDIGEFSIVRPIWYSYTMQADGKLTIKGVDPIYHNVIAYSGDCENLNVVNSGDGRTQAIDLLAGQEIFIRWFAYDGNFEWELAEQPSTSGDKCEEPEIATLGVNVMRETFDQFYWNSYTSLSGGNIEISTSASAGIYVYSGECSSLSQIGVGYQTVTVSGIKAGENILIRWVPNGGDFEWELEELELEEGQTCDLSGQALVGDNHLPATVSNEYWYTYTMQSTSKLQITSDVELSVKLYKGTCDNLSFQELGGGYLTNVDLLEGDIVYINWYPNGGDFNWVLEEVEFGEGDFCSSSHQAEIGINQYPTTVNSDYWYSYTMQSDAKLLLSSNNVDGSISAWNGSCEYLGLLVSDRNSFSISSLIEGETVYIKFQSCEADFEWELTEVPFEAGDLCTQSATAILGENHVPDGSKDQYWYSYSMQSTAKLNLTVSTGLVNIYYGDCDDLRYITNNAFGAYNDIELLDLNVNDMVYIQWYETNGDFNWLLEEVSFEEGEGCANSFQAFEGVNLAPEISEYSSPRPIWYSYTMQADGKLTIKNIGAFKYDLATYTGNCESLNFENSGYGRAQVIDLLAGQEVFIKWSAYYGNFEWELLEQPSSLGDKCEDPEIAMRGVNIMRETFDQFFWYSYTSVSDSDIEISTLAPAGLYVYSGECSSLTEIITGFQGLTLSDIEVGETILLRWIQNSGNFEWSLSQPIENQEIEFDPLPSYTVGDEPFELTAIASSNLPVSYISSNEAVATIDGNLVTIVGAGQTTITASQAGNEDFAPAADVEQVITVNKANQTITFEALTKNTFGDSPFVLSATATSDLPVSYASSNEAVATIEGNLVTIIGVGQTTITASQAGNDDFAPAANLEQVLTVEKANQTITFEALTNRTFGDSPFEITATATSDLLVSYASSNESVATVKGSTVTIVGSGETTLTATQGGNENFLSAVDVQQTLVVNKEVQSITFNELTDKVFGDESFQLVVSSSAGLSVSFSSSNENVAIIEDDVLSIVGAGETTITASQAGSSNYQSAQEVERILLVEKAPQSISFEVIEDQLFEDESVNMVATSTSGLPISFEVLNGTASIDEAVITWQEPGEIVVVAKQEGDANFLEASSVEQTFRVDKITDTQDVLSHGMIELFPNPVSERLTISGITNSNVDITVFDNTGLVVKSITLINDNLVLETHDLKEGLYTVMLKWSDGIKYLRFIKI